MTKKVSKTKSAKKAPAKQTKSQPAAASNQPDDAAFFGLERFYRIFDRYVSSELLVGSGICTSVLVLWLVYQKDMFGFACSAIAGTLVWILLYIGLKRSK